MGANHDIQAALDGRLAALDLGLDIAWENTSFVPAVGSPWLKAAILPGETRQADMGPDGGRNLNRGIYQVSVFYPAGQGSGAARDAADAVISHFRRGLAIVSGTVAVRIRRSWRGPAASEADWFQIPVSIAWFAYTANA